MRFPYGARVAQTNDGHSYLVDRIDLNNGVVHCYDDVEAYDGPEVKFPKSPQPRSFPRWSVKVQDVAATVELWDRLFEQRRAKRKQELLDGEIIVEKKVNSAKFKKCPSGSRKHPRLKCLCCGAPMRHRRGRANGSEFYGCGAWAETKCGARWTARDGWNLCGTSLEGDPRHGSDKEPEAEQATLVAA